MSLSTSLLTYALILAGLGQIALCIGSIKIPQALNWQQELSKVNPLTRQMFWVYSLYIWSFNLSFGLLSCFAPEWLIKSGPLGTSVSAFIALYWGARILIQFFYFDRSEAPKGLFYFLAEAALISLFIYLTLVYSWAAIAAFL